MSPAWIHRVVQRVEPDPDKGGNHLLERMGRYEGVSFLSGPSAGHEAVAQGR